MAKNFDASVNWKDVEWIRNEWNGALVLKGVLDAEDARRAVGCGTRLIVSIHGGRQLDSVLSGVAALPRVVEAVDGKLDVLVDGGVRSGLDVVKALALGAKACLVGRAWVWALAAGRRGRRPHAGLHAPGNRNRDGFGRFDEARRGDAQRAREGGVLDRIQ